MRTVAILSVLALAACSSNSGGGNVAAAGGGASAGGGSLNVTDACSAIPRDVVQQMVGQPLKSVETVDVSQDSGNGMASSGCVYDFGEARLVQVRLQQYPSGVDAGTALSGMRDMFKEGGEALEDVPGVGRMALYSGKSGHQQLHVQIDGSRTALFSMFRLPNVSDTKGKLIELARRVVG